MISDPKCETWPLWTPAINRQTSIHLWPTPLRPAVFHSSHSLTSKNKGKKEIFWGWWTVMPAQRSGNSGGNNAAHKWSKKTQLSLSFHGLIKLFWCDFNISTDLCFSEKWGKLLSLLKENIPFIYPQCPYWRNAFKYAAPSAWNQLHHHLNLEDELCRLSWQGQLLENRFLNLKSL